MARAAAVMERGMRALGIPGKAFLPMMVGFGCTVPAIYATRTLDSSRDRLLTGLITPFMSCGARLPVYVLLASVFFAGRAGAVVFAMYLLGIGVAIAVGFVLSRTVLFEEEPAPFVMVMPEFRLPNPRTVWSLVKLRTGDFIRGAGTVIMVTSVGVWLLLSIPVGGDGGFADTEVEDSAFGAASMAVCAGDGTAWVWRVGTGRCSVHRVHRQGGRGEHDGAALLGRGAGTRDSVEQLRRGSARSRVQLCDGDR